MNEESILKILSTPGAVVALVLWLHHRIGHVERCLEAIAAVRGIALPKRNRWSVKNILPAIAVAFLCVGCANVSQRVTSADGSIAESHCLALWPATGAIEKANVRQTKSTQSIGIEGATAEGGGTNMVSALSELRGILSIVARP